MSESLDVVLGVAGAAIAVIVLLACGSALPRGDRSEP